MAVIIKCMAAQWQMTIPFISYHPNTPTLFLIGDDYGCDYSKWSGGAVGSDGCLYFGPYNAKRVLRVDVINGTTTFMGDSYNGEGDVLRVERIILFIAPRVKQIMINRNCNINSERYKKVMQKGEMVNNEITFYLREQEQTTNFLNDF